jgi:DNA sulfur modification protein DndC
MFGQIEDLNGMKDAPDDFAVIREIQKAYLGDSRAWIVGYSGGKDSTATLQLVWFALLCLPETERKKRVYVITSDTLVETPQIISYIDSNIAKINEEAIKQKLPITAQKLRPFANDTFWVNLIGRGYPAPQQYFRWCTDRLKIMPSTKFIQKSISKYGEVVVVLGTRKSESDSRAQSMKKSAITDSVFSRNSKFSAAYSYAPIRDWSSRNVWKYLLQNPSPWGGDNNELANMYKDAEGGECPFVVDDKSPPCGTSRFGCWVCTLVERDKSMEALIQSGETWLKPLLEFRDLLASTQNPSVKPMYRDYKRRMGYVSFKSDGSGEISRGPYKFEFRKNLLKKLLLAQKIVQQNGPMPDLTLISFDELKRIRSIWIMEEGDWTDSVRQIYTEILGERKIWDDDTSIYSELDREILNEICAKHSVPSKLIVKLIDLELQSQGMTRRASIYSQIEKVFREEWRSEEEVKEEYQKKLEEKKANVV